MPATIPAASVKNEFLTRIEALREVDSIIDLARGWLQINILVVIGNREASSNELAIVLGQPRKAILDALRKMRLKGLIEEHKGYYRLTAKGLRLYRMLTELVSPANGASSAQTYNIAHTSIYDVLSSLTRHVYLYEALVALGSTQGYEMSLDDLASVVRLSPRQLDEYLSVYSNGSLRVFERVIRKCGLIKRRTCVYYRLGLDGRKILHRLPEYMRAKRSWATRVLVRITRALHPRMVLKRLTLLLSLGSAISMSLVVVFPKAGVLILGSWTLFVSFLALLVSKSY